MVTETGFNLAEPTKMKILLLVDSLSAGGMERRLIELIKGLQAYPDIQLQLVVFKDNIHYQEVFELGIPIKIMERKPKRNPMVFIRLYRLCRSWTPDLIHSWGTMSAIWAIPSSQILGIPLINGNIADAPKNLGFFDKRLFRARLTFPFSRVVVSNSLAGLDAYGVPKSKEICIYNGFDGNRILELKEPDSIRKEFDIQTKKVIGMIGSFSDRKDFKSYIKAAILVLNNRQNVSFMAVGDGPDLPECKAMVPPDYESYFAFTGIRKDVESIINTFDVGVLTTNAEVHGEGISNAILEYMALQKPTVATFGGGTDEVVKNDETGFLIPPDSPEALAEKLIYLLDRPEKCKKMGIAARNRVETMFNLKKMTTAYYELYRRNVT